MWDSQTFTPNEIQEFPPKNYTTSYLRSRRTLIRLWAEIRVSRRSFQTDWIPARNSRPTSRAQIWASHSQEAATNGQLIRTRVTIGLVSQLTRVSSGGLDWKTLVYLSTRIWACHLRVFRSRLSLIRNNTLTVRLSLDAQVRIINTYLNVRSSLNCAHIVPALSVDAIINNLGTDGRTDTWVTQYARPLLSDILRISRVFMTASSVSIIRGDHRDFVFYDARVRLYRCVRCCVTAGVTNNKRAGRNAPGRLWHTKNGGEMREGGLGGNGCRCVSADNTVVCGSGR